MTYNLIGTMYKETGKTITKDGFDYNEMEAVQGYHINMLNPPEIVESYIIEVATPQRIFAGRDDTVCLKFNNRDEWLSLGIEEVEDEQDS